MSDADEIGEPIGIIDLDSLVSSVVQCSARADRAQRAREAGQDTIGTPMHRADIAIETAMRVRVTREIAEAACAAAGMGPGNARRITPVIEAAFRAAGFEVEQ